MSTPAVAPARSLDCGGRILDLSQPRVMGIVNVTPDSFSDGGQLYRDRQLDVAAALTRARDMVADGAAIIDVGGESTRPGAAPITVQEELDRVLPVVEAVRAELDVVISVDTSHPEVMREAAACGAGLINDIRALEKPGALAAAAASALPVCLMHMQGEPGTMQNEPHYEDVVGEVGAYLQSRAEACVAAGMSARQILLDPGFGFGKTVDHNLVLLRRLAALRDLGYPLLVGLSRKSMIGKLLGREVDERLPASLALASAAVLHGAAIVRVHDVRSTVDAVRMCWAVMAESGDAASAREL